MLEIRDLEIKIENKTIIKDLNFTLHSTDKMAIIGEEGNGKSTLLRAILDRKNVQYAEVFGTIKTFNNNIGYLEQSINDKFLLKSPKQYLFQCEDDYYFKINEFYKNIKELGLKDDILEIDQLKKLSGGERVKLQLLKILLNDPDILLLDEPTNDLDIKTLEWLENFIINSEKPIIYVSHDESLLSKTANVILHLELINKKTIPKNTIIRIGYDDYVDNRIKGINKQIQVARKELHNYKKQKEKLNQIMNKVDHELNTVSRKEPHKAQLLKKKMKSIKAQEKRFDMKELTQIPDFEHSINFFFESTDISNCKKILNIYLEELKVEDKILCRKIKLDIFGNDHVVIIGNNGVGKSTLIRKVRDILNLRKDIKLGYMPQEYSEVLKEYKTPIQYLQKVGSNDEISLIRSYMGNMKFTRDEMVGNIDNLSGGSKAKLILLKLILEKCDVLILDEPTRNVSPLSNPIIRKALKEYNGTIVSISHDRKYINEVCNKVYELNKDGLKEINI